MRLPCTIGVSLFIILIIFGIIEFLFNRIHIIKYTASIYKVIIIFALSIISLYLMQMTLMYKDIVYIVQGKSSFVEGKITDYKVIKGKTYRDIFYVNGMEFEINNTYFHKTIDKIDIYNKSEYIVRFLPNSKFVLNISKVPTKK